MRFTTRSSCVTALLVWSAVVCGGSGTGRTGDHEPSAEEAAGVSATEEAAMPDSAIIAAQEELTPTVLALPGVTGTAVGLCGDGLCIKVYLARADTSVIEQIPERFRGFRVDVEVTGTIRPREGGG